MRIYIYIQLISFNAMEALCTHGCTVETVSSYDSSLRLSGRWVENIHHEKFTVINDYWRVFLQEVENFHGVFLCEWDPRVVHGKDHLVMFLSVKYELRSAKWRLLDNLNFLWINIYCKWVKISPEVYKQISERIEDVATQNCEHKLRSSIRFNSDLHENIHYGLSHMNTATSFSD